jgi:thioredoxin
MSVITLSDADAVDKFRTINSKSVMYFTATWCPPCKMIAPIYTELAKNYPDVAFGKVDVDDNQDAAMEFQIQAVPTFVFSKNKESVNKFSGADKDQLEKFVKEVYG